MEYNEFRDKVLIRLNNSNESRYDYQRSEYYDEYDGILVIKWVVRGASGGNCWGDNAVEFEVSNIDTNFYLLEKIVTTVAPKISYLEYRKIENLLEEFEEGDYEYYGNYTDWRGRKITGEKLYNALREMGYV